MALQKRRMGLKLVFRNAFRNAGILIMRIALLSDIHANLPALEACLTAAAEAGAEQLVFLGDLVGYGPDPEEVTQRVRDLASKGAIAIMGNHDEAVFLAKPNMNATALTAMNWTRPRLSDSSRAFLQQLPRTADIEGLLLVHSEASDPRKWNYVTSTAEAHQSLTAVKVPITFCGHVHVPQLFCLSATAKVISHRPANAAPIPLSSHRRWLAVIGSVGQPRDGDPAASFATFDTATREIIYRRAPYDMEATAEKIRKVGLPERLAERLLAGS